MPASARLAATTARPPVVEVRGHGGAHLDGVEVERGEPGQRARRGAEAVDGQTHPGLPQRRQQRHRCLAAAGHDGGGQLQPQRTGRQGVLATQRRDEVDQVLLQLVR